MAKIDKNGNLKGVIGNLVLRNLNDNEIAQSKNTKVRQTTATKQSGAEFGEATRISRAIRTRLEPFINQWSDAEMHGRFTGQVFKAISSGTTGERGKRTFADAAIGQLLGFDFNKYSPFEKYCNLIPEVEHADGVVKVKIPSFNPKDDFKKVNDAEEIELGIAIAAVSQDRDIDATLEPEYFSLTCKTNTMAVEKSEFISGTIPPNADIFILAMIFYKGRRGIRGENILNHKKLNPCIIAGVLRG
jgi:hypothetical protein